MSFDVIKAPKSELNTALHKLFEEHEVDSYICSYTTKHNDEGIDLTISCDGGYLTKVIRYLKQFYDHEIGKFNEQEEN